ncbi:MAG: packaged DNA stabilization protein gp10 [Nitrospiraceae bacterium]|nr:packaged DNA stabilization protein gp10 [Nitrospiraceae bacterium]
MALTPISLGLRSNPGRSGADGAARIINGYAENAGDEGKLKYPVYAMEGYTSFATPASGGLTRALLSYNSTTLYGVTGQRIFRCNTSGTCTDMAAFATSGTVTIARNRKTPDAQIAIVSSDGLFRIIDTSNNSISSPTPPDGAVFTSVCQIDGYFVFTLANGEWYISEIDGSAIDTLDFAKAESNPDGLVVCKTRGSDLVLLGEHTTEFWTNTGNTDFPFERAASASFGCYAAGSAVEIVMDGSDSTDSVIFAATNQDGAYIGIRALNGYQASKISTHAVDRAVQAETTPANLRACTWSINGHTFYAISGTSFTWVYDTTTQLWHERESSALSRWRISDAVQFGNKLIIGDYSSGVLYQMTTSATVAADSVVNMYHSNDNGSTFVGPRAKTIGQSSSLKQRFKWNRIGQSKEDGKVFKLVITNAVSENGTGLPMTIIPPHVHAYPNPMRFDTLFADVVPGSSQSTRSKAVTGLAVDVYAVKG